MIRWYNIVMKVYFIWVLGIARIFNIIHANVITRIIMGARANLFPIKNPTTPVKNTSYFWEINNNVTPTGTTPFTFSYNIGHCL